MRRISSALLVALCCGIGLNAHTATNIFTEDFESPVLDSSNSQEQTGNGRYSAGWIGVWAGDGTKGNRLRPSANSAWLSPVPSELGAQFATVHSGGYFFTDLTDS